MYILIPSFPLTSPAQHPATTPSSSHTAPSVFSSDSHWPRATPSPSPPPPTSSTASPWPPQQSSEYRWGVGRSCRCRRAHLAGRSCSRPGWRGSPCGGFCRGRWGLGCLFGGVGSSGVWSLGLWGGRCAGRSSILGCFWRGCCWGSGCSSRRLGLRSSAGPGWSGSPPSPWAS